MFQYSKSVAAVAVAAMLSLCGVAHSAAVITIDTAANGDPKPNLSTPAPPALDALVTQAIQKFNSRLNGGSVSRFELENSNPFQASSGAPRSFSVTSNASICSASLPCFAPPGGRYNTTTGLASADWGHWLEAALTFTMTFSESVSAFGFMGTDFYDFGGSGFLELLDANDKVITTFIDPGLVQRNQNGSILFFGVGSDTPFKKARFTLTQADPTDPDAFDFVGIDSLVIGNLSVPEPASLALVGLGLAGIAAARRRRTQV